MRKTMLVKVPFILALLSVALLAFGQAVVTSIDEIVSNPGKYPDSAVEIEGWVAQYVPATSTSTSYYLLKGSYGAILKVNTAEPAPEINRKYRVVGIVYVDPVTREPFVSEKSKTCLDCTTPDRTLWEKIQLAMEDPIVIAIVALVLVLIVLLVFLQVRRRREIRIDDDQQRPLAPPPEAFANDLKTVKINAAAPKTMKFIPGQMVIVSGEDKGKSFRIAGFPTSEGSIITIGRDEVKGERAFAHLQLDNRFRTVSRKQAELIAIDGKLYVRNMSDVNLTQVDGRELKEGEKAELKPNGSVKMGALELKYVV